MPGQQKLAKRVVLLGWDAADWRLIQPLIDQGRMPTLRSLIERGAMGGMATMQPPLSPLLWTSAATGAMPDRHGILGFAEPDPVTGGVRVTASTSRQVKAIWNILHHEGLRSVVVNWFASHPAEPVRGAVVSELYSHPSAPFGAYWPLPAGTIHPSSLERELAGLRVHPGDLTGNDLAPFVPRLEEIDQAKDRRVAQLAGILADTISVHAAATWLLEREEWDFAAIYYDTIDHAGHEFMKYHPPAMAGLPERDCVLYRDVMTGVCCFHDLLLGRILQLAGPDAHIMIVSDHGMQTSHLQPDSRAWFDIETPALAHRSQGIFCLAGAGIRHDELVYGAELVDVTPTVLSLFGLPAGADMAGKVLVESFDQEPDLTRIPSWEDVPGDFGIHLADASLSPAESAAVLKQLADLGYIEQPSEAEGRVVKFAVAHHNFNLARVHLSAGHPGAALPLLESLVKEDPGQSAYRLHLAQCYFELGRMEDCRAQADRVLQHDPNRPAAGLIRANLAVAEGKNDEALALLLQAEKCSRPAPEIRYLIGQVYLNRKQPGDAERVFLSVLALDADHADARAGLAEALLCQKRFAASAEAALDAIRLKFDLPAAHFTLGCGLSELGQIPRAIQAFETCVALRPGAIEPHRWLTRIHERVTKDAARASHHRALAERRVAGRQGD